MKKLIMLCAIVAAAVSVNAASLKWGGAICAEDGVETVGSSATAYLLYSDSAFGTITKFNTETKTTDAGGTLRQTYAITSTDAANYSFTETYNNTDYTQMNGYYAMVLVSGSDMYYETFQVTEYISPTTPKQDKTINAGWSGSEFLGDPARKGTVEGVPEPTSGLLLLVGAGLLGLRRKQK